MKQLINDLLAMILMAAAIAFFLFPRWGLVPYLHWCEHLGRYLREVIIW